MGNLLSSPIYDNTPSPISRPTALVQNAVPQYDSTYFSANAGIDNSNDTVGSTIDYNSTVQNPQPQTVRFRCRMIDDQVINYILRQYNHLLTPDDQAMGREAQSLCTTELNSTMSDCELDIYLTWLTVIVEAGNCANRVVMLKRYDGEIEWKFTRQSFTQCVYSSVKWVGRKMIDFFNTRLRIGQDNRLALT
ncbi:uncharacterized protein [Argopecten irradians]|uniref:uncharacterized protein n=1 Tax=Argopecten irradians TaxID=31199 RepID=UPI003717B345